MKAVFTLSAFFLLCALQGCFIFDFERDYPSPPKANTITDEELQNIIKQADYGISNMAVLKDPSAYRGKIIALAGTVIRQTFVGDKEKSIEISGNTSDRPFNFILRLNHSLSRQTSIDENVVTVTDNSQIRVFAEVKGIEEFLYESGNKRLLPVAECIAIYQSNDRQYRTPVWRKLK